MKHIIKKKIKYTNALKDVESALNNLIIIKDFLPPPKQLIKKEPNQKIIIYLIKKSVSFFKKEGMKKHIPYQQIIRNALGQYPNF